MLDATLWQYMYVMFAELSKMIPGIGFFIHFITIILFIYIFSFSGLIPVAFLMPGTQLENVKQLKIKNVSIFWSLILIHEHLLSINSCSIKQCSYLLYKHVRSVNSHVLQSFWIRIEDGGLARLVNWWDLILEIAVKIAQFNQKVGGESHLGLLILLKKFKDKGLW